MSQVARINEHQASHPDQLAGWKEIGWYLGRGTRTVQRWERELGLPIHRIATGPGRAIYAYKSEIDSWRCREAEVQATAATKTAPSPEPAGTLLALAATNLGTSCTTLVHAVVAQQDRGASSEQRGTNCRVTITVDIDVRQPGGTSGGSPSVDEEPAR